MPRLLFKWQTCQLNPTSDLDLLILPPFFMFTKTSAELANFVSFRLKKWKAKLFLSFWSINIICCWYSLKNCLSVSLGSICIKLWSHNQQYSWYWSNSCSKQFRMLNIHITNISYYDSLSFRLLFKCSVCWERRCKAIVKVTSRIA